MKEEQSRLGRGQDPAESAGEPDSRPEAEETGGLFPLPAGEAEEQSAIIDAADRDDLEDDWSVVFPENAHRTGKPDKQKEAALARRLERQRKAAKKTEHPYAPGQEPRGSSSKAVEIPARRPVLPAVIIALLLAVCIGMGVMLFRTRSMLPSPESIAETGTTSHDKPGFPPDIDAATRPTDSETEQTETTVLTETTFRKDDHPIDPNKPQTKTTEETEDARTTAAAEPGAPVTNRDHAHYVTNPPPTPPVITAAPTKTTTKTTTKATTKTTTRTTTRTTIKTTTKATTKTTTKTTTTATTTQIVTTTTAAPVSSNMMIIADSIYAPAGAKNVSVILWLKHNSGFASSSVRAVHTLGLIPCRDNRGDLFYEQGNTVHGSMSAVYYPESCTIECKTLSQISESGDGYYVRLYFDVPENAVPGTVYYIAVYPDSFADDATAPILCESYGGAIIVC